MQSPYKKIIVYDLETGGLSHSLNNITEIAMVAIDLENLSIIEEFSIMIRPSLRLQNREEEPIKEAKELFKMLKIKEEESNTNILKFKDHEITLKNLEPLIEEIEKFYEYLDRGDDREAIDYEELIKLERDKELSDITKLYFDKCYNPQALEVTHISRMILEEKGVSFDIAFKQVAEMFERHAVGNSKPILAGHNIKNFDNPFFERFFQENNKSLSNYINSTQMIDTLEWARLKWFELSGYNLGICANEVGLTLKEAHRALPDTVANAKFLIKMLENLRGKGIQESEYERRKFRLNF